MTAKRLLEYSDGNIDMEISEVFDNLELHLDRTTSLTTRQKFKLLLVLRSCLKIRSTERLPMEEILRIF